MKGMIFTEFFDLVEDTWGLVMSERLIELVRPASGGVYTAVGNYEAGELLSYVTHLSREANVPVSDLQVAFGKRIFLLFTRSYGRFFAEAGSAFAFLAGIENYIHVEVRKLYPDAQLPTFSYPEQTADRLDMEYRSSRPLAHFALGLIEATVAHYGGGYDVDMQLLDDDSGRAALFSLRASEQSQA